MTNKALYFRTFKQEKNILYHYIIKYKNNLRGTQIVNILDTFTQILVYKKIFDN